MVRYFGSAAVVTPPGSLVTMTPVPEGGWVPIIYPRATQASDHTYFGGVDGSNGNIDIWDWDNLAGTYVGPTTLHPALAGLFGPPDDHAAPAIHVRTTDDHLLVVYCTQGDNRMRRVVSANPLDITNWSSEGLLNLGGSNYLYPTLAQLSGEGPNRIYMHWKDFPSTTYIRQSISNDGGVTFSASVRIFGATNTFFAFTTDDATRMDFVCSDTAPTSGSPNGLFHFYEIAGQLYETDGTPIAAGIPIASTDATQCYSDGGAAFPYSIVYDGSGNPVVACAEFGATVQYFELRWDGAAWVRNDIDTTAAVFFGTQPPGITHVDADRVIYGKKVGSDFVMYEATTVDDGATWTPASLGTTYTGTDIPQTPTLITKSTADLRVLWTHGVFTTDYDYLTGVDGTA